MNIQSMQGGMGMMGMGPMQSGLGGGAALSDDQKQLISDTLEQFDAENLTEADATSIVNAFSEAGIQPGREMAEAMSAAGFNAREVGELAGVEGPPPGKGGMQGPRGGGGSQGAMPSVEAMQQKLIEQLGEEVESVFNEDGSVNFDDLKSLMMSQMQGGSSGMLFSVQA